MSSPADVALSVLAHLPGWSIAPERFENQHFAELARPDGAAIHIYVGTTNYGWAPKGRVRFVGSWPKFRDGTGYYPKSAPQIGCAMGAKGEYYAKEIKRRLLPAYEGAFATAKAYVAQHEADADEAELVAGRLISAIGGETSAVSRKRGDSVVVYPKIESVYRMRVEPAYSDTPVGVSFELHRVPPEMALSLLEMLKAGEYMGTVKSVRIAGEEVRVTVGDVEEVELQQEQVAHPRRST